MTILFKDDSLEIHHRRKRNYYELSISYKQFKNRLNELYKTNVFFSTYRNANSIDGFLPLTDQFYIRVSVIHRLGAIGVIDEDITHEELVKLEVLSKKENIVLSVYPKVFKNMPSGMEYNVF